MQWKLIMAHNLMELSVTIEKKSQQKKWEAGSHNVSNIENQRQKLILSSALYILHGLKS